MGSMVTKRNHLKETKYFVQRQEERCLHGIQKEEVAPCITVGAELNPESINSLDDCAFTPPPPAQEPAMLRGNETEATDFTLLGFFPELRHITVLVPIIFLIYTAACTGNTLLILLIWLDSRLHTPMYFLLSQLSVMDLTLASSIIPKMLTNFFSGWRNISFLACGAQIFFSLTVAIAECMLITFMCFDRYVAICKPLRYTVIVSPSVCLQMTAMAWAGGALTSLGHTVFTLHFHICGPREIPHFFCEVMAVLRIVCEDISVYEKAVVVTSILVLLLPLSLILSSYVVIFLTVLQMSSPEARSKALATCSSHLCVVGLYFGPGMFIYMRPGSARTPKLNQGLFLFGTVLTPFLNPLAYSFRNKEVLSSLKKLVRRCHNTIIMLKYSNSKSLEHFANSYFHDSAELAATWHYGPQQEHSTGITVQVGVLDTGREQPAFRKWTSASAVFLVSSLNCS
ncbi:PREDICTED: olfactory receptor 2M5-like [Chinchilla lanigera]|uniref:olfactory receptor 2M5-like n=1 Tax=Chinchilla lanigera TaxID=34839 RepID=UPI0006981FD3|nr:PREDICTED: olfactory receptor 2M5-like [Chinchilla lanigera]